MTPPPTGRPSQSGRMSPPATDDDMRRRAHDKLAERVPLARSRHKPLSLLRAEAKRVVEQFADAEYVTLPRADRDRWVDDVLAESFGYGPLEELYRDPAVTEVMVLAAGQVIARKGDGWLPTSHRFRDAAQVRAVLRRYAELGEPHPPAAAGAVTADLPNGFRVLAVVPPDILDLPPTAVLVRRPAAAPPAAGTSSGVLGVAAGRVVTPPPTGTKSGIYPGPGGSDSGVLPRPVSPPGPSESGVLRASIGGGGSAVLPDPIGRFRQRVTERIIAQLAAAGVYDLNRIPAAKLRAIVTAYVDEMDAGPDGLGLDDDGKDRIAIDILAGMNR